MSERGKEKEHQRLDTATFFVTNVSSLLFLIRKGDRKNSLRSDIPIKIWNPTPLTSSSCFIFSWAISNWLLAVSFSRKRINSGGQWLSSLEFSDRSACGGRTKCWKFSASDRISPSNQIKFKADAEHEARRIEFEFQRDLLGMITLRGGKWNSRWREEKNCRARLRERLSNWILEH